MIIEQAQRFGRPLPKAIQDCPTLHPWTILFYQGFLDLTTSRSLGMAVGPISLVTMLEYCEAYEIEGEQREDFLWMVSRLDHKYLEWSQPKDK